MTIWQRILRAFRTGTPPEDMREASNRTADKPQLVRSVVKAIPSTAPEPPTFDLAEVDRLFELDSYARQAVSKYVEFAFKQGWDFVSDNPRALKYIKTRFDIIADATGIPTEDLFRNAFEHLVKYHNCFIAKARDANFRWPRGISVRGIYGREPVVGYFLVHPSTMKAMRDRNGMIRYWEQDVGGGEKPKRFKPEDIIHIPYQRSGDQWAGHPFLLTAREDIRSLRQLEDLVLRMVFRNINPLVHAKVGTEEMPAQPDEVDSVTAAIENAPTEGYLVTTERVSLDAVALDQVIEAEPYLKYFERRVFTALGVPETLMGRGQGASRATSESMHSEFLDRVEAYQRVLEAYVNHFMMRELLLEGGFDPVLNPGDSVEFRFREIDFDELIKRENHAIFKYEHNAITEDEMRRELGKNPITDRGKLYMNLVAIPLAQAKARTPSQADTANRVQPRNQHTQNAAPSPGPDVESLRTTCQEQVLRLGYEGTEEDLQILEDALVEARRG